MLSFSMLLSVRVLSVHRAHHHGVPPSLLRVFDLFSLKQRFSMPVVTRPAQCQALCNSCAYESRIPGCPCGGPVFRSSDLVNSLYAIDFHP